MKAPSLIITILIGLMGLCAQSFSQTITSNQGFLNCYRRNRDSVFQSGTLAQFLKKEENQKFDAPVQSDKLGWRFSFEQISPDLSERIKTLLVSACLEIHPKAREDLSAPAFSNYISSLLEQRTQLLIKGTKKSLVELVVLTELMAQDSEISVKLGPILFLAVRQHLLAHLENLYLSAEDKNDFTKILSYPFDSLNFENPHPFTEFSGAVFGTHELFVHVRKFQDSELMTMVVHESCHLNARAGALREKEIVDLTNDDWVFLTLQEEFRARYTTARFEDVWNNCIVEGCGDNFGLEFNLRIFFQVFLKTLKFIQPKQEVAVTKFLNEFSRKDAAAQEAILRSWIRWD